jgi:hypothetical protein
MKKLKKEYEIVAEFEKDNCVYIIRQPKTPPNDEELKGYYSNLVKVLYN